jgi:glycosyltransferase involved in cell wall biosynthesis
MTPRGAGAAQPLRVLYVSPNAALGGAERVTLDLIALHDRSVVEPSICFLRDGPLVLHCRETLGVPTHLIVAPSARRFLAGRAAVRALADLITSSGVDLVHSAMAWGHIYGGRAARRAGKPAIWYQHVGASWSSRIEVWASLITSAGIIANSEFTAVGQRRVNPRRVPIHVVHPGTRLPEEPYAERRANARLALGIGDGEFAVGIAARLQPWKGQDVVIRAAASLLHARRQARLLVIGDAMFGLDQAYAASLPALAQQLAIADRVTMTGFRPDVLDVLPGLDLAIHASTTPEPFGLGLIEAMAAGTALIAADAGAAREIVTPGEDGLLTPPGDHEALATAMLALCDDPERRTRLAMAGGRTARDRFGAEQMTRIVEDLYRTICPR